MAKFDDNKKNKVCSCNLIVILITITLSIADVVTDWATYNYFMTLDFSYITKDDPQLTTWMQNMYLIFVSIGTGLLIFQFLEISLHIFQTRYKESDKIARYAIIIRFIVDIADVAEEALENIPIAYITLKALSTGHCSMKYEATHNVAIVSRIVSIISTVWTLLRSFGHSCCAGKTVCCSEEFKHSKKCKDNCLCLLQWLLLLVVVGVVIVALFMDFIVVLSLLSGNVTILVEMFKLFSVQVDSNSVREIQSQISQFVPDNTIDPSRIFQLGEKFDATIVAEFNADWSEAKQPFEQINRFLSFDIDATVVSGYSGQVFRLSIPCDHLGLRSTSPKCSVLFALQFEPQKSIMTYAIYVMQGTTVQCTFTPGYQIENLNLLNLTYTNLNNTGLHWCQNLVEGKRENFCGAQQAIYDKYLAPEFKCADLDINSVANATTKYCEYFPLGNRLFECFGNRSPPCVELSLTPQNGGFQLQPGGK